MKHNPALFTLYAVTDRTWLGERTLAQVVEEALAGGVTLLQLREKGMPEEAFIQEARTLLPLCRRYRVPLIINDNVSVALRSGADGVHLGQEDMPLREARRILGPDKIIGISARTVSDALRAEESGADYLGVGAVFSTSTKRDAAPVSRRTLREICAAVSIPVCAIGGITLENAPTLAGTGIAGLAVVSAVFAAPDIEAAAQALHRAALAIVKEA